MFFKNSMNLPVKLEITCILKELKYIKTRIMFRVVYFLIKSFI